MALLELTGVRIHYGGIEAVKGIALHVDEGEIVTIIGANGAGKTTFINMITGHLKPSKGPIASSRSWSDFYLRAIATSFSRC